MKPIGYWLNRTDQALTHYMDGMLGEFGLTRVAWQALNAIRQTEGAKDADVLSTLSANADSATLRAAIDTLLADAWASRPGPDRLALTPEGLKRLADVQARVDAFRELSTAGITPEDYRTAVLVLERITRNLESPSS
ncbi:MarR family winged helix-turn-helix transcriptional regulator [Streptomyces sp. NPDC048603]|uniref:MarR family winged helix-turn-helix transcriptional regulator n=1 Tax=Streptomyces sp. NPDC048603 TaxID=3365577 RepID=UPI00371F7245